LQQDYEYVKHDWQSRLDTKLLYNKHKVKTRESPIHPVVKTEVDLEVGEGVSICKTTYETNDKCVFIDSYELIPMTKQEQTWFRVDTKVTESLTYDETVKDEDPIEWEDDEYEIQMQDTTIEVDDWELVLIHTEPCKDLPHIVEGSEDITYKSIRIDCGKMFPHDEEEKLYEAHERIDKVKLLTKSEKLVKKDYAFSKLTKISEEKTERYD